jgi:hypothetical protein
MSSTRSPDGVKPVTADVSSIDDMMKAYWSRSEMADLSLNSDELNRAALTWLKEAKADAPEHHLHLLTLAAWGMEKGVEGEWPAKDRARAAGAGEHPVRVEAGERDVLAGEQSERAGRGGAGESLLAAMSGKRARRPSGGNGAQRDLQPSGGGQPGAAAGIERIDVESRRADLAKGDRRDLRKPLRELRAASAPR